MMMNACLILVYLSFYILQIYRKKHLAELKTAKMATMVLGMINSVLVGLLFGAMFQGQLALSTIYSILLSLMIGFIIGKPLGGYAIIEALCSSFMGSMMGAMLAAMLSSSDLKLMISFMDGIYIISMSIIIIWFNRKPNSSTFSKKHSYSILVSVVLPIMIVTSIMALGITGINKHTKTSEHQHQPSMKMNM
jgi:hypothetical protein